MHTPARRTALPTALAAIHAQQAALDFEQVVRKIGCGPFNLQTANQESS